MMNFFAGRGDFASKTDIMDYIKNSKNFDPNKENPRQSEALLIFSTSKQHTWLVASSERLYCILDDIRKENPHINWSMAKFALISGNQVTIQLKTRPHTDNTGLVDISDDHRDYLFTPRLFSDAPIEERIAKLIQNNMTTH